MNTQQQDINLVQHEEKWQAPKLVELGSIANDTLNSTGGGNDSGFHNS